MIMWYFIYFYILFKDSWRSYPVSSKIIHDARQRCVASNGYCHVGNWFGKRRPQETYRDINLVKESLTSHQ